MEDASRQLSDLYGIDVYTMTGTRVGTVADALIDFNTGDLAHIAVDSLNPNLFPSTFTSGYRGLKIPSRWIRAADDIVIVVKAIERVSDTDSPDIESTY